MKWIIALWLLGSVAWAQTADPVVYFSLTESLEDLRPLEGAEVPPGPVWFKVEPGSTWEGIGFSSISTWCCKGVGGGSTDPHGPKQDHPHPGLYVDQRDLSGYLEGSVREFYMDCYLTGQPYEHTFTNFTIRSSRPATMPTPIGDLTVEVRY